MDARLEILREQRKGLAPMTDPLCLSGPPEDDETRYTCARSDGTLTCVHCDGSHAHRHEGEHCPVDCKRGHSSCEVMSAGELREYMKEDL